MSSGRGRHLADPSVSLKISFRSLLMKSWQRTARFMQTALSMTEIHGQSLRLLGVFSALSARERRLLILLRRLLEY
ncbi:unnamed protein product [Chondrus crispus]|uniref:Uncharacterized protein n=1 Tax=Chondrus crispus TaxID=2769 RepID=R7Q6V6_CHOCR|nr:unnamed protein product [Chondrus crispus]CDF33769.1 unnamed protein product [Chondrus crispus]|eukprot:XP_005713588.1 unnamed protein product [Chondrus crispus]